jgi:O-antigen ligase
MKKSFALPAQPLLQPSLDYLREARFAAFCLAAAGAAFSISLCAIAIGLYTFLLLISCAQRRAFPIFPHPVYTTFLVAVTVISALGSIYPNESIRGFLKFTQGLILFYAGFELIRSRRDLDRFVAVFMFCEVLAALSALWQEWSGADFIRNRPPVHYTAVITRLTGPFNHCNDFATFLLPGIVLAVICGIAAWSDKRRRSGLGWGVITLLLSYAMIRTMSRGATLGLLLALMVVAAGSRRRLIIFAGAAVGIAALVLIPSPFGTRLAELLNLHSSGLQERWYLLKGTWKMIEARPWFGMGLNTYSRWFPIFNPPNPAAPVLMYAHNSFAQIAAETGIVGLSALFIFWCSNLVDSMRAAIRSAGSSRWFRLAFLGAAAGILVNAMFDSLLQSTQLRTLFWMLLGATVGLSRGEIDLNRAASSDAKKS